MKSTLINFKELDVWKKARELRIEISTLTKRFPDYEKFRLADQVIRASRSVTANLAEGFGRFHYGENIQFCRLSRGSLYELLDHLICACDEGYIDDKEFQIMESKIISCLKLLNGYIGYLNKARKRSTNNN